MTNVTDPAKLGFTFRYKSRADLELCEKVICFQRTVSSKGFISGISLHRALAGKDSEPRTGCLDFFYLSHLRSSGFRIVIKVMKKKNHRICRVVYILSKARQFLQMIFTPK